VQVTEAPGATLPDGQLTEAILLSDTDTPCIVRVPLLVTR
jgi:hypothetical protein